MRLKVQWYLIKLKVQKQDEKIKNWSQRKKSETSQKAVPDFKEAERIATRSVGKFQPEILKFPAEIHCAECLRCSVWQPAELLLKVAYLFQAGSNAALAAETIPRSDENKKIEGSEWGGGTEVLEFFCYQKNSRHAFEVPSLLARFSQHCQIAAILFIFLTYFHIHVSDP